MSYNFLSTVDRLRKTTEKKAWLPWAWWVSLSGEMVFVSDDLLLEAADSIERLMWMHGNRVEDVKKMVAKIETIDHKHREARKKYHQERDDDIAMMIERLTEPNRKEFALWCVKRVLHLIPDDRSRNAIDVYTQHLHQREVISDKELLAADKMAQAAADDAFDVMRNSEYGYFHEQQEAIFAASCVWANCHATSHHVALALAWEAKGTMQRANYSNPDFRDEKGTIVIPDWMEVKYESAFQDAYDSERAAHIAELERLIGGDCTTSLLLKTKDDLEKMKKERDDARREVCMKDSALHNITHTDIWARNHAKARGWDCFKEDGK